VVMSDAVHMVAAGIWIAGVWLLAWTLWRRRRRGEPLDARLVATRFSVIATLGARCRSPSPELRSAGQSSVQLIGSSQRSSAGRW